MPFTDFGGCPTPATGSPDPGCGRKESIIHPSTPTFEHDQRGPGWWDLGPRAPHSPPGLAILAGPRPLPTIQSSYLGSTGHREKPFALDQVPMETCSPTRQEHPEPLSGWGLTCARHRWPGPTGTGSLAVLCWIKHRINCKRGDSQVCRYPSPGATSGFFICRAPPTPGRKSPLLPWFPLPWLLPPLHQATLSPAAGPWCKMSLSWEQSLPTSTLSANGPIFRKTILDHYTLHLLRTPVYLR